MTESWIDISVPLRTGMVHWPGDPEPILERIAEIDSGDEVNVTFLRMTAHSGTHMDAPCHFLAGRNGMESYPFEAGIGPARVIEIAPDVPRIGLEQLQDKAIQSGERLLFKTRNSTRPWDREEFRRDFVALTAEGAQYLVDRATVLVGIDYLSIGLFAGDGAATHKTLLDAGVWILEGLNLHGVPEGQYQLICLPLPIEGADGAPARAILRPIVLGQL